MLAENPELHVMPLPEPALQSAMPPGATRFALDFQHCLERVHWTVSDLLGVGLDAAFLVDSLQAAFMPDSLSSESTCTPLVPALGQYPARPSQHLDYPRLSNCR